MYYYVDVRAYRNNEWKCTVIKHDCIFDVKSICHHSYFKEELKEEVLKYAKDEFNKRNVEFDYIEIYICEPSCMIIPGEYPRYKEDTELMSLYTISDKELEEYRKSDEGKWESEIAYMVDVKRWVKSVKPNVEKLNKLDAPEYLDFIKYLNEYGRV